MAKDCDVLILGAGVSGLSAARELALGGAKVCLLERAKVGAGASSNSLRIIHGGFRYLQKFELGRLVQSCKDQAEILNRFPGQVKPLKCLMPIGGFGLKSPLPCSIAATMYGAAQRLLGSTLPAPRVTKNIPAELSELIPGFALEWHDAQVTDLGGFFAVFLKELRELGVELREDVGTVSLEQTEQSFAFELDAEARTARALLNATGAGVAAQAFAKGPALSSCNWAQALNLVFESSFPLACGLALEGAEGRMLFATPRPGGRIAIGTWYEQASAANASLSQSLVQLARDEAQSVFKLLALSGEPEVEWGTLPSSSKGAGFLPTLIHSEELLQQGNYFEMLSTKFTTFPSFGRKVAQRLKLLAQ